MTRLVIVGLDGGRWSERCDLGCGSRRKALNGRGQLVDFGGQLVDFGGKGIELSSSWESVDLGGDRVGLGIQSDDPGGHTSESFVVGGQGVDDGTEEAIRYTCPSVSRGGTVGHILIERELRKWRERLCVADEGDRPV